ncbi:hypothetical protein [Phytohabitans kaempferiae]|uniref:Uncharacterized protein n=1 Tax=Phytohabitans kaempferiae TaxID=1620943 RepID=A0ABV6M6D3_9ACTN
MADQHNQPGRDGYNITDSTVYIQNNPPKSSDTSPPQDEVARPPQASGSLPIPVVALGALILFLAIVCTFNACNPHQSPYPTKSDKFPEGAESGAILDETVAKLEQCAREVVLSPSYCPQGIDLSGKDRATKVHWYIHGNPRDGAQIHYSEEDRYFHVLGLVVMTVSYELDGKAEYTEDIVPFWGKVQLTEGKTVWVRFERIPPGDEPKIRKQDPGLTAAGASDSIRAGFQQCANTRRSPMPDNCPVQDYKVNSDEVTWTVDGDPSLNVERTFDQNTGIVHILGNYAMTRKYAISTFLSKKDVVDPISGKYDASFTFDGGKPKLLSIKPRK